MRPAMPEPTITFKRALNGYTVLADGVERGTVWSGWNIYLAAYWIHSEVPDYMRRNPARAWATRRDAARALLGLEAPMKEPNPFR